MNIEMNQEILLSYTEFPENHIQDILDIDPAKQPAQGKSRRPQILRREFLALLQHVYAALQRDGRLPQQLPLPFPGDQTTLALSEKVLRENDQGGDQPG